MSAADINTRLNAFLVESKVKLRVNDAAREHGQIRAFQNNTYDITKVVPTVVMRNEDYGRIARILADGTPVNCSSRSSTASIPMARPPTTPSPRSPARTRRTRS